ncbi:CsbD family protein [Microbacterium foliorum]
MQELARSFAIESGKATNDKSTTADGHADQAKAAAKKAGQNVKDSLTDK